MSKNHKRLEFANNTIITKNKTAEATLYSKINPPFNLVQKRFQSKIIQTNLENKNVCEDQKNPRDFQKLSFNCLPDYIRILLPDGSQIPISQIKPAQQVLSYNLSNRIVESKKVVNIFRKPLGARHIFRISHQFGFLECTEDHRIFTTSSDYIRACCLSNQNKFVFLPLIKDRFDFIDATKSLKTSVCTRKLRTFGEQSNMLVYDIEVEDNHNFFAERLLVRN